MGPDKRDLVGLAYRVAERLVGTALEQLLGDAVQASGGSVSVDIRLAPPATRLALPSKGRGRQKSRVSDAAAGPLLAALQKKSPLTIAALATETGLSRYYLGKVLKAAAKSGALTVTGRTSGRLVHRA